MVKSHWLYSFLTTCFIYEKRKPMSILSLIKFLGSLQWRHNERDGVSYHQPHDCLLKRLFRRKSKKTSKLRVTGLCGGIHRWPVNSPHKWPVTQKMFPFDDVIVYSGITLSMMCSLFPWLLASLGHQQLQYRFRDLRKFSCRQVVSGYNAYSMERCRMSIMKSQNIENVMPVIGGSWWRRQMETFSALLALSEGNPSFTGGFPSQRPATGSFDVFFDLRLNKRLSKQ